MIYFMCIKEDNNHIFKDMHQKSNFEFNIENISNIVPAYAGHTTILFIKICTTRRAVRLK